MLRFHATACRNLWAWRAGRKRRERLLVCRSHEGFALRAGSEPWPTLRFGSRPEELVSQWQSLQAAGFKIRTRALTTTLFARLFLGDLFLHGLGGGKYQASGDLTIRGVSKPVLLPFTLAISGDTARMNGSLVLNRTAFGIGQGQWKTGDVVASEVTVTVALTAHRAH